MLRPGYMAQGMLNGDVEDSKKYEDSILISIVGKYLLTGLCRILPVGDII